MALILVIEDNPVNLELIGYLLQAHGHRVMSAGDGRQGLAMAQAERPDLVVCDLQMPGMDGHEVASAMRADPYLRHIPLLAVTAAAMVGDRDRALEAGFDAHVSKPIDPQRFVPLLEAYLPRREAGGPVADVVPGTGGAALPAHLRAPRTDLVLLLVDDRPLHQEYKRELFEPAGYAVQCCGDGGAAWEYLQSRPADCVVSDVMMPGMDGWELLRRVRAAPRLASLPFIFLTSTARDSLSRWRAMSMGADAFLVRPIDAEVLLRELRAVLDGAPRG